jgi:DNA-binding LacI/PurR family transcriptional regulator/DNA-binding transcriptional regulator YhcF (GntR family)
MRKRCTPMLEQAVRFLEDTVARHRRLGQPRLPTVSALAQTAGVATVTMWKAVHELCGRGDLSAKRGLGLVLPEAGGAGVGAGDVRARAERRWEVVKAGLARDILEGAFRSSATLPSPKELSQRYGACYRTVRRAIRALVDEGVLEAHKRTYVLRRYGGRTSRDTVVLVGGGYARGELRLYSHRTHELLRQAEAQCSQAGVRLEVVAYDLSQRALAPAGRRLLGVDSTSGAPSGVLGCMVLLPGVPEGWLRDAVPRVLRAGLRVALLDETTVHGRAPVFADRRARTFSLAANRSACRQMALHLRALGHRRVAFLSPIVDSDWGTDRGEALAEAFAAAGAAGGVVPFVAPASSSEAAPSAPAASPQYDHELEQLLARSRMVKSLRYQMELVMQRETVRGVLTPLMERAHAAADVTAWVAANDDIALECMDYLEAQGRRVPGDISVAGFDDNLEAFFRKLTSFNYNEPGAIHAMLSHVLEAGVGAARSARGPVTEVSGFVNVRGTTGRVRKA